MSGTTERATSQKAKLVIKDLGNPKKVDPDKHNNANPLFLGVIKGKAFGIKTKVDAKGEAFEALQGYFIGEPADPSADVVASGMCYLPGGFHEIIVEQLRGAANTEVQFAYGVYVVPANNPIGYSYLFRPVLAAQAQSLLAIGSDNSAGFAVAERGAAPSKEPAQAQTDAPAQESKGGKHKAA